MKNPQGREAKKPKKSKKLKGTVQTEHSNDMVRDPFKVPQSEGQNKTD